MKLRYYRDKGIWQVYKLTGNARYRESIFGKLVLQVEVEMRYYSPNDLVTHLSYKFVWRDATTKDFPFIKHNLNGDTHG